MTNPVLWRTLTPFPAVGSGIFIVMNEMITTLQESGQSLRDLFFPRRCIACGKVLESGERHLCPECFDELPLTWFWSWSGNPAEERMWHLVGIERATSLFFYREGSPYRHITPAIKYKGDISLGTRMGRLLGRHMVQSGRFDDIDAVVPVPLHPLRRWSRGYNQAEVIARPIAAALGEATGREIPVVCDLLRRTRYTRSQTTLAGEEKRRNLQGAFEADLRAVRRLSDAGVEHLLITDDVLTSGSTLEASTSVLLPYFRVSIATLGFVP